MSTSVFSPCRLWSGELIISTSNIPPPDVVIDCLQLPVIQFADRQGGGGI